MKIYLASRYSRREELCGYREQLRGLGLNVQARWLDGKHQIANDGAPIGHNGEKLVEDGNSAAADILRSKFAMDDFYDCSTASIVISFTEVPRSSNNRGGRHVEFGLALANRARVIVIGHRENIFHWLPWVEFYETWEQFMEQIQREVSVEK